MLLQTNDALKKKVEELEMNNKELRALSLLAKQNLGLKKQMSELESKLHEKRSHVLDEILACDTFVPIESVTSSEDSTISSDINSEGNEEEVTCPLSPKKRKPIQSVEHNTPQKSKKKNLQKSSADVMEKDTSELQIMLRRSSPRFNKKKSDK
jgi:hypothetical protein